MSLEKRKLDNGLTIYNDHITGARTNDVRMYVPYGSANEDPGDEGVAHVFEHCVHLQTDMFDDQMALEQFAYSNGMITNATTNFTRTNYFANGLEIEPSMVHLSQILQHTHFPAEEVEHELKAVRREVKMRLDDPGGVHFLGAMNAMFGLPYGRSIGGYSDKIEFDVDTLRALHERYYKLGNMTLMVAGKARMDEVAELAERYFTPDDDPTFADTTLPLPTLGSQYRTGLVREDSSNALVSVSYPVTPEFYQQLQDDVLVYTVAQRAMSKAALQALRYERGISYDGSIGFGSSHPNVPLLGGDVTTDGENVDAAIEVFDDIFNRTGDSYSDEKLQGMIAATTYINNANYASTSARMNRIESALEDGCEPIDVSKSLRKLAKMSVQDVRAAIDDIAAYTAERTPYVHVTGKRAAIGEVERMIDQSEVA